MRTMYDFGEKEARTKEKNFAKSNTVTAMGLNVTGGLLSGGAIAGRAKSLLSGRSTAAQWGTGVGLGVGLGAGSGWLGADPENRGVGAGLGALTSVIGGRFASDASTVARSLMNPGLQGRNLLEGTLPESIAGAYITSGLNMLAEKSDDDRGHDIKR